MRAIARHPIARNPIVRSIGGVGGAAALAQGLNLLAAPIASRLFSEADFGRFGLFFGLSNALVTLAILGLPDALVAASSDDDARTLLGATGWALLLLSPALALVTLAFIRLGWFGYGALPMWSAVLMAVQVAVVGAVMAAQLWLIRRRVFRRIALGHVVQGGARAAGQVAFGALGAGFLGLALADACCRVAVLVVSLGAVRDDVRAARHVSLRDAARMAWRYRLFPLFRTPSMFANNLGTALPPSLVTMAYGVAATGLYTLMNGVLVVPIALVQKAVGDVFLGHFAAEFRRDREAARRFLLRVAAALAAFAACTGIVVYAFGEPGFALVFGEKWRPAGRLARLLVPLLVADLTIGPLGTALNVANRPDAKLLFDVSRIGAFVGAYLIARATHLPLDGMIAWFGRLGVASYVVYALLIYFGTRYPRAVRDDLTGDLPAISG